MVVSRVDFTSLSRGGDAVPFARLSWYGPPFDEIPDEEGNG
jgi:hypothetical protein